MFDRQHLRELNPFTRLGKLLADLPAGRSPLPDGAPLILSVGEPRNAPPEFILDELGRDTAPWGRYPAASGAGEFEKAAAAWLARRYGLGEAAARPGGLLDPARCVLPVPGSREGLFFTALAVVPQVRGGPPPAVLLPTPGYHVYASAAVAAGAEPVFVPATRDNGFLPDYAALSPEILDRAALCFLCSPSNPQGAAASLDQLCALVALSRRHGFVLVLDECYAELYNASAPPGGLQAAHALGQGLDGVLVFHSLSKRSSAAGLRCGVAAGDPALVGALDVMLRAGGAGVPQPVLAAGARLWREEAHVEVNRALYRANFAIAERVLGNRFDYRAPAGGFFMWLDVGDGEAATRELWTHGGIRVLPGGYMAQPDAAGHNPGHAYIRAALVDRPGIVEAGLTRLAEIL